jgi:uncharacterized glyoxalase superfamily protein PhnB
MPTKPSGAKKARPTAPTSIPTGFSTVTPYLSVDGAAAALEFYKKAFGAREINRQPGPGGTLLNAQIQIGESIVMLSDVFPGSDTQSPAVLQSTTVTLHIYSENVDKLWKTAVEAGAEVAMPLEDQFWGERYGRLRDPFGHLWSVSMVIPMSTGEMAKKRREAMKAFSEGSTPPPSGM